MNDHQYSNSLPVFASISTTMQKPSSVSYIMCLLDFGVTKRSQFLRMRSRPTTTLPSPHFFGEFALRPSLLTFMGLSRRLKRSLPQRKEERKEGDCIPENGRKSRLLLLSRSALEREGFFKVLFSWLCRSGNHFLKLTGARSRNLGSILSPIHVDPHIKSFSSGTI